MEKVKPLLVFFGVAAVIVVIISIIRVTTYNRYFIKDIEDTYKALVIETYNPREWIKEPTSVKIRKNNGNEEDLALGTEIMGFISIGDSLIKIKDENICFVKKPNGEKREFYYRRISMKRRNHWTFPKEWKNKWMESSAWDTIPSRD